MQLDNLDPETRAAALVGRFLQEFAIAEEQVTTILSLLMDVNDLQRELLLDGMPVGNKFRALKEVAAELPPLPPEIGPERIRECATALLKANTEVRVHVAHKRFTAGTKDLVVVKPGWKGEVLVAWTTLEFTKRIQAVAGTRRSLYELNRVLANRKNEQLFAQFAAKMGQRLSASRTLLPSDD